MSICGVFSYTANIDKRSCNSRGSTEVIVVMYGVCFFSFA